MSYVRHGEYTVNQIKHLCALLRCNFFRTLEVRREEMLFHARPTHGPYANSRRPNYYCSRNRSLYAATVAADPRYKSKTKGKNNSERLCVCLRVRSGGHEIKSTEKTPARYVRYTCVSPAYRLKNIHSNRFFVGKSDVPLPALTSPRRRKTNR